MEPGTGEVDWAAVARALRKQGYTGVIGLEAAASGDPIAAMEAFRAAFSERAPAERCRRQAVGTSAGSRAL